MRLALIAGFALALGSSALAQDKAPTVDQTKLSLARDVVEASDAGASFDRIMSKLWPMVSKAWTHDMPESEAAVFRQISDEVQSDFHAGTPRIVESIAQTYATDLSEQELKDWLEWLKSPSGRAITAKNAQIAADSEAGARVVMTAILSDMPPKVANRICEVQHCTPTQRANIETQIRTHMQSSSPNPAG